MFDLPFQIFFLTFSALFMFRKTINDLPETVKEDFIDTDPKCVQKVKTLKHVIQSQFPVSVNFSKPSLWYIFNAFLF